MEKAEIMTEVKRIVASVVKHENFEMKDELTAADVDGWDSLSHMIIITGIEEKFNIKFKLKELNKLKNMGSLIEMVQSKLNG